MFFSKLYFLSPFIFPLWVKPSSPSNRNHVTLLFFVFQGRGFGGDGSCRQRLSLAPTPPLVHHRVGVASRSLSPIPQSRGGLRSLSPITPHTLVGLWVLQVGLSGPATPLSLCLRDPVTRLQRRFSSVLPFCLLSFLGSGCIIIYSSAKFSLAVLCQATAGSQTSYQLSDWFLCEALSR